MWFYKVDEKMSQREGNVLGAYCVFIKNLHADKWKEVGSKQQHLLSVYYTHETYYLNIHSIFMRSMLYLFKDGKTEIHRVNLCSTTLQVGCGVSIITQAGLNSIFAHFWL